MSILKFFVRAMAVVPDELMRYISKEKTSMSISPNRGFVKTSKYDVRVNDRVRIAEPMTKSKPVVDLSKDDGPLL